MTYTINKYKNKDLFIISQTKLYNKFKLWSYTKFFINRFKKLKFKKKKYTLLKIFRKYYKKKFSLTTLKFLNKYYISQKTKYRTRLKIFSLSQRLFISSKNLIKKIYFLFYKKNNSKKKYKIVKKKVTFLNFNKKPIWKMRKARYAHWDLRLQGTLNKYRYDKLLGRELNHYLFKFSKINFLTLLFLNLYGFLISWKQIYKFVLMQLIVINGEFGNLKDVLVQGDILEFPSDLSILKLQSFVDKKFQILLRRAKKRAYTDGFFFWKKKLKLRKKKVHKIYKKLNLYLLKNYANVAHDPTINTICILNIQKNIYYNPEYSLVKHSVIGLQNWRYNFD